MLDKFLVKTNLTFYIYIYIYFRESLNISYIFLFSTDADALVKIDGFVIPLAVWMSSLKSKFCQPDCISTI